MSNDHQRLHERVSRLEREVAELKASGHSIAAEQPTQQRVRIHPEPPARVASATEPRPTSSPVKGTSFEAVLVGTWSARLGALVVLIGAAFGFQFAIESGLIGPLARVLLGVAGGLAFIAAGEAADRRNWPRLTQALCGGGIALLYLCVWAALQLYALITPLETLGLAGAVTALCGVLALRHDSKALAFMGAAGGFLNPFMVGSGLLSPAGLFAYVVALDLVVVALAHFRKWPELEYTALGATWILYGYSTADASAGTTLGYATILFGLFTVVAIAHLTMRRPTQQADMAAIAANAFLYSAAAIAVLPDNWHAPLTLGLTIWYAGLLTVGRVFAPRDTKFSFATGGLALGFAVVTIPFALDTPWITPAWGALGLALLWVAHVRSLPFVRAAGLLVLALSSLSGVVDVFGGHAYVVPIDAREALILVLEIVIVYAAGYLHTRRRGSPRELERFDRCFDEGQPIAGTALTVLLLSLGARTILGPYAVGMAAVSFINTALLAAYATVLLTIGVLKRLKRIRLIAIGTFAIALIKLAGSDFWLLETGQRMWAGLGLGTALLICSLMYHRFRALIEDA